MKKICDSCFWLLSASMHWRLPCLALIARYIDGLDPSLLDGWVKVDAVIEGKSFKETQTAGSDEVARRLV